MPYTAEITRKSPSCLLFLIDQSGSMDEAFGADPNTKKADALASAMNKLLLNIITACTRSSGVNDYFDIGIIGYTTDDNGVPVVGSVLQQALAGRDLVPVLALNDNPLRIEDRKKRESDGAGGIIEVNIKMPVWVEPTASYGTPMVAALQYAHTVLQQWVASHPDSFPPIVVHITDGESTDGDPVPYGMQLTSLATTDGNVLLFNCHLASRQDYPVIFPGAADALPQGSDEASQLFSMSSVLPPSFAANAAGLGYQMAADARAFVFNADIVMLVDFMDIGTRSAQLLK